MLQRWKNTTLYIVLLVIELTIYFVYVGNSMAILFIVLGIVQLIYFLPKIITEFKAKEG